MRLPQAGALWGFARHRLWLAPLWGAVAIVVLVGLHEARRPDLHDPADLRRLYSGPAQFWPKPWIDPGVEFVELAPAALPAPPAADSPEGLRQALGERLFNDPKLSASGHFACQSCHHRRLGWGDGLPRSFGHGRTEGLRNAPALFAAGRRAHLFWDGRAQTLQEQALGPLGAPNEMANHDLSAIAGRLGQDPDYPALFASAFGSPGIALERVQEALASFQRHLDRPTRFDQFLSGRHELLSDEQILGLHLFRTKARCANCHFGPNLTDDRFHNLGLSYYGRRFHDLGRHQITGQPEDAGRFLTPSLRHLARTGPYMHNGLFPSLRGLVNLYAFGGGRSHSRAPEKMAEPLHGPAATTSPHIRPLDLSEAERQALTRFLEAL